MNYHNCDEFKQLQASVKGLSDAISSLKRQEAEDRAMREELITMLPDILAALCADEPDDPEEDPL